MRLLTVLILDEEHFRFAGLRWQCLWNFDQRLRIRLLDQHINQCLVFVLRLLGNDGGCIFRWCWRLNEYDLIVFLRSLRFDCLLRQLFISFRRRQMHVDIFGYQLLKCFWWAVIGSWRTVYRWWWPTVNWCGRPVFLLRGTIVLLRRRRWKPLWISYRWQEIICWNGNRSGMIRVDWYLWTTKNLARSDNSKATELEIWKRNWALSTSGHTSSFRKYFITIRLLAHQK